VAGANRLDDLRRRVREDPASFVFSHLAEECRRAGALDEAIRVCRAGLRHHPEYLSARVTLGRALLAAGALDEAAAELSRVLSAAPENLSALRSLAELHRLRGDRDPALQLYDRALALAPGDRELLAAAGQVTRVPPSAAACDPASDLVPRPAAPAESSASRAVARLEAWLHAARQRAFAAEPEEEPV
jgi:tetratricopeptide (TPR) repeat protein